jgi:hypothetical protein
MSHEIMINMPVINENTAALAKSPSVPHAGLADPAIPRPATPLGHPQTGWAF